MGEVLQYQYFLREEKKEMNENIAGFITCPICHETHQELRVNKNRKLYMFCDNGCAIKLNNAKSKRYLPVLLSGSDVKDEQFGLIISAAKGKKQDEIKEKGRYLAAGRAAAGNDNGTTGSSTGSFAGRTAAGNGSTTGSSTGSDIIGRPNGQHTTAGNDSIFGRAAKWLAADDDDE